MRNGGHFDAASMCRTKKTIKLPVERSIPQYKIELISKALVGVEFNLLSW